VKYVAFSLAFAVGVPLMALVASFSPKARGWLLALLVLSTALGDLANINFLSLETYRGPDRGFEVSLSDLVALGLVVSLLVKDARAVRWLPAGSLPFVALAGVGVVSTALSPEPVFGMFTLFKMAKFYLVFWCVVNVLRTGTPREFLWWGFVSVAAVLTVLAVYQKYGLGIYRVHATFDHSNTIPAFSNLILPALLMWGLVDPAFGRIRATASGFAALGLLFCVVATFSRAGLLMSAALVVGSFLFSLRHTSLSRITVAGFVALALGGVGAVVAADSVVNRFREAPESSEKARDEFNRAAVMMADDHLFGVGLNNFSHVLSTRDRYRAHIAVMQGEEQSGVAHHIYYLTAAEMGYVGLGAFLLWLGGFMTRALWHGLRGRTPEAALLGAFLLGMGALHAVGLLEWVFRLSPVLYLFGVVAGATVAFADPRRMRALEVRRAPV
jgi:hypothetical protein